ncbi:hypothetical protein F5Y18DRAFT_23346 [Xylariaceae sp. FL1019]|nr:hypothetical protein F5Y18DRAFT_23346 [Xylariaceae sp. FL1019]
MLTSIAQRPADGGRLDAAMESEPERLKLPGFGIPVSEVPHDSTKAYFMHALWDGFKFESDGIKLREIRMMDFMNQITDKPGWEQKVFDEQIVNRWREEATGSHAEASGVDLDGDVWMTEKMFKNCIMELRDKIPEFKETGLMSILDAEVEVVKSDSAIDDTLLEALKATVKPLEDVPDRLKDWHPGSEGKVLDLLHPSLFPMIYGVSRVLPHGKVPLEGCEVFIGRGETCEDGPMVGPSHSSSLNGPSLWGNMQWLPSDINWSLTGEPRISSYINNLHPVDHRSLYPILEKFVAAATPLWERCLYRKKNVRKRFYRGDDTMKPRISVWPVEDEEQYSLPEGVVYDRPELEEGEEENDYLWSDEYQDWLRDHRILKWPEPDDYNPSRARPADKRPNLRNEFPNGLQVIFKLAKIHLTPSDPEYGGGSLHVEGALNDRIVATALYYYDCENITESFLDLYHPVDAEELRTVPMQNEFESLERWLGISTNETPLRRLGKVATRQGRLLAFPNVLAHQVRPFKLADPTRPGHRKILAMFLVDPNIRVLSTSVVPPQRKDWWAREIQKIRPLSKLPLEIFDLIIEHVDGQPMSWNDALAVREKLMQERSWVKMKFDQDLEDNTYNFCEH